MHHHVDRLDIIYVLIATDWRRKALFETSSSPGLLHITYLPSSSGGRWSSTCLLSQGLDAERTQRPGGTMPLYVRPSSHRCLSLTSSNLTFISISRSGLCFGEKVPCPYFDPPCQPSRLYASIDCDRCIYWTTAENAVRAEESASLQSCQLRRTGPYFRVFHIVPYYTLLYGRAGSSQICMGNTRGLAQWYMVV
jgi:hypothetical protein